MAKERSIDISLIKSIDPNSPGAKGRITLRRLFKDMFLELNVPYNDICCNESFIPPGGGDGDGGVFVGDL